MEPFGAKGLAWAKVGSKGWQSPIQKFLSTEEMKAVEAKLEAEEKDLLLLVADPPAWSIRLCQTSASIWAASWG